MLKLIPRHHFSSEEQQYGTGRAAALELIEGDPEDHLPFFLFA